MSVTDEDAILLCTVKEEELEKGKYWLRLDVVPKKKAEDKLKKKKKDGFIAKAPGILGLGKSQVFKVRGDSIVSFEIGEGIQPMSRLKEGEDKLKCRNFKKEEVSRQIHLEQAKECPEDHAAITFSIDGEFLHRVTISDIRKDAMVADSIRSNRTSDSGLAASIDYEAVPIPPSPEQSEDEESSSGCDTEIGSSADTEFTLSRRSTVSTRSAEIPGSSVIEEFNKYCVFRNKSLDALSEALGPRDARRLLIQLNMEESHILSELHNHPQDCASAYASLFNRWKKKELHRGEPFMRQEMNMCLERIGRNDIKIIFMRFAAENVELTPGDFKGHMG